MKFFVNLAILLGCLGTSFSFPIRPIDYHLSPFAYPNFELDDRRWDGSFFPLCVGTQGEETWACMEQIFWQTFQFESRRIWGWTHYELVIARAGNDESIHPKIRAKMWFRRGQFAIAMLQENKNFLPIISSVESLQRAHDLDPENHRIESWLRAGQIAQAVASGQEWQGHLERLEALIPKEPVFIAFSIIPATIGLPMSTGLPQRAIELLESLDLECKDENGCVFPHAHFNEAGSTFTRGDFYARVGDKDKALNYFQDALAMDPNWPLANLAQETITNIDDYIGQFESTAPDKDVVNKMIINGRFACMMCHGPK